MNQDAFEAIKKELPDDPDQLQQLEKALSSPCVRKPILSCPIDRVRASYPVNLPRYSLSLYVLRGQTSSH